MPRICTEYILAIHPMSCFRFFVWHVITKIFFSHKGTEAQRWITLAFSTLCAFVPPCEEKTSTFMLQCLFFDLNRFGNKSNAEGRRCCLDTKFRVGIRLSLESNQQVLGGTTILNLHPARARKRRAFSQLFFMAIALSGRFLVSPPILEQHVTILSFITDERSIKLHIFQVGWRGPERAASGTSLRSAQARRSWRRFPRRFGRHRF